MFTAIVVAFNIFLAIVVNQPRHHIFMTDDGGFQIREGRTILGEGCVAPELGCIPGDNELPFFRHEDSAVTVYLNDGTTYSFCIPNEGCDE